MKRRTSGLTERVDQLTREFVEQLFAAIRASSLAEVRSDLAAARTRPSPPSKRSPTPTQRAVRSERISQPPKSERRRHMETFEEESPTENAIIDPEALLRAAFGDANGESERATQMPDVFTPPPSSRVPASSRVTELRADGAGTGAVGVAAPVTSSSSASRVIRRRRF